MSGQIAIRRRRRQRGSRGLPNSARAGVLFLVVIALLLGAAATGITRLYLEVSQQVPNVEDIQAFFQQSETAGLRPSRIVDTAGLPILTLENPAASERRWVGLQPGSPVKAPDQLVMALLAQQDRGFWENPGYQGMDVVRALVGDVLGRRDRPRSLTITEQLVASTLLPIERYPSASVRQDFKLALLAERLTAAFDKRTVLTWYLNSADFGHFIHGVDAASLVYFGKHADELSLGESALLAAMPGRADQVLVSPTSIRRAQRETLEAMQAQGMIGRREALQAQAPPLHVSVPPELLRSGGDNLERMLLTQAVEDVGSSLYEHGGLTIVSTIDRDLQQQASCALQAQIARLNGRDSAGQRVDGDNGPCIAAGLLPLMRPGDAGVNHAVTSGSVVVLNPKDGTLMAAAEVGGDGAVEALTSPGASGRMVYPFIYLTAFSRGLSPGSMVLDLPAGSALGSESLAGYRGPERMRTALANGDRAATSRTVDAVGLANIARTLQELALTERGFTVEERSLVDGEFPASLLDLAYSYAVVANQGLMVTEDPDQPAPILIRSVDDLFGRTIRTAQPSTKVVLGEGLSYLLLDVLTDATAASGSDSLVVSAETGLPHAALHAANGDGTNWSVFFTPSLVVAVRLDWDDEKADKPATPENASDPLATAVLRYVSADQPAAGWAEPAQVQEVEVCDPSGLLPTVYCPKVVTEVFLLGTEPTALDDLYQPFRVNTESGNLATLQTPLELVQERVYMVPPPEASEWARQAGIERPPTEYDPLAIDTAGNGAVSIVTPSAFAPVAGELVIRGQAHPEGLQYYRLQYGRGLNPARWTQIGEDRQSRVWGGILGQWDTDSLSGLYTLQLIAVLDQGEILTDSVPVTIDNQPPTVEIRQPQAGGQLDPPLTVEIGAEDNTGLAWVDVYLDGRKQARLEGEPFLWTVQRLSAGEHELYVRAQDTVGNETTTPVNSFQVAP